MADACAYHLQHGKTPPPASIHFRLVTIWEPHIWHLQQSSEHPDCRVIPISECLNMLSDPLLPLPLLLPQLLPLLVPLAAAETPAAGSRYLMQERYPPPGKGAPPVAANSTAATPAPATKTSSAGGMSGSALLAVAAAAAAVFAL
jgi:hypothetical protein